MSSGQIEETIAASCGGTDTWGVAQVRSYQAGLAMDDLEFYGLKVFYPKIKTLEVRREKRRKLLTEPVIKPLFPGYLFVGWPVGSDDWARAMQARGVADLIRSCGKLSAPSTMPATIMASLFAQGEMLDLTVVSPPAVDEVFTVGEVVAVKRAGFEGQLFRIARLDRRRRIRFILHSMNPAHRNRELKASAEDLKKVAA